VSVRIYVEGGFEPITKSNCRRGFRAFLEKTVPSGSFKVIASGDRGRAYKDFCTALVQYPSDYIILLVDSEEAVVRGPWEHLAARTGDGWRRPATATDDQAQLMVQVMESWFIADPDALAQYYGQRFHRGSLPRRTDIEQLSKADVFRALENATRMTLKGQYHKTQHGFELVERIDPGLVRAASNHAERLLNVLERETATR
jgi:Domain of unknown function (DUF4276)